VSSAKKQPRQIISRNESSSGGKHQRFSAESGGYEATLERIKEEYRAEKTAFLNSKDSILNINSKNQDSSSGGLFSNLELQQRVPKANKRQ